MNKKIVRLAVIRKDEDTPCPFGLNIPFACKSAGDLVVKMAPTEMGESDEEKSELAQSNTRLLVWRSPNERCKFAGAIFEENKDAVECNWNTSTAGTQEGGAIVGSPFYYKHFSGVGLDGVYTFPLGYYVDTTIDRPYYYGLYSLEGVASRLNSLIKESSDGNHSKIPAKSTNKK